MADYRNKYMKYKKKYLDLLEQEGGSNAIKRVTYYEAENDNTSCYTVGVMPIVDTKKLLNKNRKCIVCSNKLENGYREYECDHTKLCNNNQAEIACNVKKDYDINIPDIGFETTGASCYLNAALQYILSMKKIVKYLVNYNNIINDIASNSKMDNEKLYYSLQSLKYFSNMVVDIQDRINDPQIFGTINNNKYMLLKSPNMVGFINALHKNGVKFDLCKWDDSYILLEDMINTIIGIFGLKTYFSTNLIGRYIIHSTLQSHYYNEKNLVPNTLNIKTVKYDDTILTNITNNGEYILDEKIIQYIRSLLIAVISDPNIEKIIDNGLISKVDKITCITYDNDNGLVENVPYNYQTKNIVVDKLNRPLIFKELTLKKKIIDYPEYFTVLLGKLETGSINVDWENVKKKNFKIKIQENEYNLSGYIAYTGSHYVFLKRKENTNNWILFNDSRIQENFDPLKISGYGLNNARVLMLEK